MQLIDKNNYGFLYMKNKKYIIKKKYRKFINQACEKCISRSP